MDNYHQRYEKAIASHQIQEPMNYKRSLILPEGIFDNDDHMIVVSGAACLTPQNFEKGLIASKWRHVQILAQPGCRGGKVHSSPNTVGDKTVLGIWVWESEEAFANWFVGQTSIQVFSVIVDYFVPDSIQTFKWRRCVNPLMSTLPSEILDRSKRLFDPSLDEEAFSAVLWFRPTPGEERQFFNTLWSMELFTRLNSGCISFDTHIGIESDNDDTVMVYLAFDSEIEFQKHLNEENSIIGERICVHLDDTPLLTTWNTVYLTK